MKGLFLVLPLIAALTSSLARADILFLDYNISSNEVRAAREAATQRDEKLIVLPAIPQSLRNEVDVLKGKIARSEAQEAQLAHLAGRNWLPESKLASVMDQSAQAADQTTALYAQAKGLLEGKSITTQDIAEAIERTETEGRAITSLVISGHSYGDNFWGLTSKGVTPKEIETIFSEHSRMRAELRSLMLWGCYSNTPSRAAIWREAFPLTSVILGFGAEAPEGAAITSPALLKDGLLKDSKLAEQGDIQSVQALLRSLKDANQSHLTGAIHSCFVGIGIAPHFLADADLSCKELESSLPSQLTTFQSYFEAKTPEFAEVPAEPHSNVLRHFYNSLQAGSHCPGAPSDLPKSNVTLALLFYPTVRANFAAYYGDRVAKLNGYLLAQGAPKEALIPTPITAAGPSRQELNARVQSAFQFLSDQANAANSEDALLASRMRAEAWTFRKRLYSLECIPGSWVTESPRAGMKPAEPVCAE
jgi:hypothetical protein